MTSTRSTTHPPRYLLILQEQEALANKNLAATQADIAKGKALIETLKKHHYEHSVITEKVAWFARENNVSFEEMMARYAWNRLLWMKEEKKLITLRSQDMATN